MSPDEKDRAYAHKSGYGCFFKSLGVLLVLLLLCGTGVGGCFFVRRSQYRQQLADAVARVRGAGEPVDGAELNAFYKLRDENKDRTPLYVRALAPFAENSPYHKDAQPLPIVGNGTQVIPSLGQDWAEFEQVDQFLAQHRAIADWLHEAGSESGSVRYPVDFQAGIGTLLPHAQQVRGAARFLDLEARARMQQGDHAGAAESLVCQLRMGESLSEEPIIISQLVRLAVFSIFTERLKEYLAWGKADDADLARLQAAVAEVDIPRSFTRALQGERAIAYETVVGSTLQEFEQIQGGQGGDSISAWLPDQAMADLRPGDSAMVLITLTEMVEASKHPFPQAAEEAAAADARLQQFFADDQQQLPWDRHMLTMMLLPALKAAVNATSERTALQRAALAAIAVERYRLAHQGQLPQKLKDLVPDLLDAVPIDPCDGQPLRLRMTEKGFVVYSVGMNKADDQGDVGMAGQKGLDIGVKVER